jgi:hypothetical protein
MRKLYVRLLVIALIVFGTLFAILSPRHCSVTRGAFNRIEVGMTRAEVETILGGPPGDYSSIPTDPISETWSIDGPANGFLSNGFLLKDEGGMTCLRWDGNDGAVWLVVDERELVVVRDFVEAKRRNVGLLGLLWWRLGGGR